MFLTSKDKKELEAAIKRHPAKGVKKDMIIVHTETGSKYEFDFNQMRVRRISTSAKMRKDEEWNRLVTVPEIVIGLPMKFAVDIREDNVVTLRTTTYVVKVEEV